MKKLLFTGQRAEVKNSFRCLRHRPGWPVDCIQGMGCDFSAVCPAKSTPAMAFMQSAWHFGQACLGIDKKKAIP
jgi:hypothetical protein